MRCEIAGQRLRRIAPGIGAPAVGWALALNSAWGVLGAVFIEFLIALRIGGEEKVLREGLPGYVEYTQKVRHRLIPYVW